MIYDEKEYNKLIDELYSYQDIKFRDFSKSLMPSKDEYILIGVRFPLLKKLAKNIANNDYNSFININTHNTFEEIMLHGLLIGYLKEDINTIIKLSKNYIPYITNWALCDSFVANLHILSKYPSNGFKLAIWALKYKKTYYKRVGYVILLNYYIKDEYISFIFSLCDEYIIDDYYVKMSIAWLISMCYIKYPKETLNYLKNNKLDSWTHNKSIQKIRESRQVSDNEKNELKKWKK